MVLMHVGCNKADVQSSTGLTLLGADVLSRGAESRPPHTSAVDQSEARILAANVGWAAPPTLE